MVRSCQSKLSMCSLCIDLLNTPCDAISVQRSQDVKRLPHHYGQRILPDICFFSHRGFIGFPTGKSLTPALLESNRSQLSSACQIRMEEDIVLSATS